MEQWDPNRYYYLGQSRPESNRDEGLIHTPKSSKTGVSPPDAI